MDLQAKHNMIRRKLEIGIHLLGCLCALLVGHICSNQELSFGSLGTQELMDSVKEIDRETRNVELKNVEEERVARVAEREARDEAKAATKAARDTHDEIYATKRNLTSLAKEHAMMVLVISCTTKPPRLLLAHNPLEGVFNLVLRAACFFLLFLIYAA